MAEHLLRIEKINIIFQMTGLKRKQKDEQDRLDIQHKVWELAMKGELYWAPIENPENVLDIGTGTGIWAIQFAKKHPQTHVIGTDLSLIQPANTPPNCEFIRDDIEDPWIFQTSFDFVHLRVMFTCFDNPRGVSQKVYDNMKLGGWIEYQDMAMELVGSDPAAHEYIHASELARWANLLMDGLRTATGRDPGVTRKLQHWMREIGFVDVVEKQFLCPLNSWPLEPEDRRIGQFTRLDTEMIVESSVKLLLAGGLKQEELPAFKAAVKHNLGDSRMRGYWIFYAVYGRKPEADVPVAPTVA